MNEMKAGPEVHRMTRPEWRSRETSTLYINAQCTTTQNADISRQKSMQFWKCNSSTLSFGFRITPSGNECECETRLIPFRVAIASLNAAETETWSYFCKLATLASNLA